MRILRLVLALSFVGTLTAASPAGAAPDSLPEPVPCEGCWFPPLETSWQIQFSGRLDRSLDVDMYEIDMFDSSRAVVTDLHEDGRRVVCYVSAGSWERWRPDADEFPKSVLGKELDGWPGERWLDIRKMAVLKPLLRDRIELCKEKGFDGIEFDNVNGFQNRTGFSLTPGDQMRFNAWLANEAHRNGLSVALKNDGAQVRRLVDYFDWALVEQCFQYDECEAYRDFIDAGKPVMEIEYRLERSEFCEEAERLGFNAIRKHRNLDAWIRPCP
jgi:hypothetical protein